MKCVILNNKFDVSVTLAFKKSLVSLNTLILVVMALVMKVPCIFFFISTLNMYYQFILYFSSPEPTAQVSFSDCLSVVYLIVVVVVNVSHVRLLLQNHWACFN